jgi:ADP-ribose pyrophosphatase YjhB (NUDIX family)
MAANICIDAPDASAEASARDYPTRPWVGVGVVVWKSDRVLLVRRGRPPRQGEWSIPGGGQDLGETVFEAAIREVLEETALMVRPTGIITVVDSIIKAEDDRIRFHYTLVEIAAEWVAGEPVAASDAEAVRWATVEEANALIAWDETRRIIAEAARLRPKMPPAPTAHL